MKYMTGNEIRKAYLEFFKSKEHLILHSFPLIPEMIRACSSSVLAWRR